MHTRKGGRSGTEHLAPDDKKALQMYEPRVLKYTLELIDAIEQRIGTPMNMQEWFAFYSFDVMGDITFGKAFNMLSKGEPSPILGTIQTTLGIVFGYLGHLPWAFAVFKKLPIINGKYNEFWKWVANQLDERAANKEAQDDVFWWLLNAHQQGQKTPQDTLDLQGDTFLSIVAGSDPSATALTNIFFHLATNRRLAQEIQNIIDQLPPADYKSLMKLDILDGLINETFRLHPPAPSGTQRVTPPEGMFIGENWIPGNVIVQVPLHTVYLDDRAFDKPLEFRPERWTTHPELVRDKSVFIPFNGGPYACAGKQLALMELRLVVAEVLRRYDFALAPSQTEKSFWAQQKDHYTLAPSPLWLQFTKRARGVR
ncbi:hypothetical protein AbraIFM66951_006747 [Aspergillus brasiliensis]|nr:hypothetical protein AbraIFM66951_006747 [Aspergillus brasiliensis]